MRSTVVLLILLIVSPVPALSGGPGVLAELPFLDPLVHEGPLYPGHIRIDLSPRPRRPFPMLLDTGTAETLMTPLYARALGISLRSRAGSDSYRRSTILGRDLQLRVDVRAAGTGSRSGFEYGLLGTNFLRAYVIEVDYQKQRVRFLDPELWSVSEQTARPGEWILPMGFSEGRPTLEIDLGSGSAHFLMDTGAGDELTISSETAQRLGIEMPESVGVVLIQNPRSGFA